VATVSPQQALNDLMVRYPHASSATAGLAYGAHGTMTAVAYTPAGGFGTFVDVAALGPTGFSVVKHMSIINGGDIQPGGFEAGQDSSVQTVHLTRSSDPDFLVEMQTGDRMSGAVISNTIGTWEPIPFDDGSSQYPPQYVPNLTIQAGRPVARVPNCKPDCATGGYTDEVYIYDAGKFIPMNGDY
jgi:hypothetical protein